MSFSTKLVEYRNKKGIIQQRFAELVGITPEHLNRIEKGVKPPPKLAIIYRMIRELQLNPDEEANFLEEAKNQSMLHR